MSKTLLIADSGSSKTQWVVIKKDRLLLSTQTKGINPYFQSYEEVCTEIRYALKDTLKEVFIDEVFFYGAGCTSDKKEILHQALSRYSPSSNIYIYSDLLAAARASCGNEKGIVCIAGTGSNSGFYDGKQIVKNIPPLGFILGDEGSGAALGKLLISEVLKGLLPASLRNAFFERFGLTCETILDKVYHQPFPNRFLAGFSPFLTEYIEVPEIRLIVANNFRSFFKRNIMQYDYKHYPSHFTGSIAYFYKEILTETANELGVGIGKIIQAPMSGLIDYHKKMR